MEAYAKGWHNGLHDRDSMNKEEDAFRAAQNGLVDALRGLLPYVLNDYLECHGYKCRHPTCASCWGDDYAAEQSDKADIAIANAKAALASIEVKS